MFEQTIKNYLLDLVFPKKCLVCNQFDIWLCKSCQSQIIFETPQICIVCKQPSVNGQTHPNCQTRNVLDGMLAAGKFHQLQNIIHSFKYELVSEVSIQLSKIMINFIETNQLKDYLKSFTFIPVPLHRTRLRYRGFNQSELLAKYISEKLNTQLLLNVLKRNRNTSPQILLDKSHRKNNIQNAFVCPAPGSVKNLNILLIDDITTTGSTLNECAKVLKQAGAQKVWGLVLAHG